MNKVACADDPALMEVRRICSALPEAQPEPADCHVRWHIRNRTFAWFLYDHHGDGRVSICVKDKDGSFIPRMELRPDLYYRAAYLGHYDWFCMRLAAMRLMNQGEAWGGCAGA